MSVENVKQYFSENELDYPVLEFDSSSATVELAAKALGVEEAMIAKTLAFWVDEKPVLIVTCGTARIDNKKFKQQFMQKAKMLGFEEVEEVTGHPVGGVCPFGLKRQINVYLDISLKKFNYVFPAAGSRNSATKMSPDEMQLVTGAQWVDVCQENT